MQLSSQIGQFKCNLKAVNIQVKKEKNNLMIMGDFGFMFYTVFSYNSFSYKKKYFSKTSDSQTLARDHEYTHAYRNKHALDRKINKVRGRPAAQALFLQLDLASIPEQRYVSVCSSAFHTFAIGWVSIINVSSEI
jgi:hypothetical protein